AAWHWRARRGAGRALAAGATLALVVAVALAALPILTRGDGRLRVTVLDVGQGDAIVVETPDGRAIVVDAGAGGPWRLAAGERAAGLGRRGRGRARAARGRRAAGRHRAQGRPPRRCHLEHGAVSCRRPADGGDRLRRCAQSLRSPRRRRARAPERRRRARL